MTPMTIENASGNLELDELIYVVPEPGTGALVALGLGLIARRRDGTRVGRGLSCDE